MPFSIEHETTISLENIPVQWISMIKLYNPALPQFPMKYVHSIRDGERIFGFPVSYTLSERSGNTATFEFKFLSNISLDSSKRDLAKMELRQRIGAQNPVVRQDIEKCGGDESKRQFLLQIWDSFIIPTYGGSLPFGSFYEGMLSMARCAAAFNPLSGGKSELQMLYDFIRHYGEKVNLAEPWNFFEFFLLPAYDELLQRDLDAFPKYEILQNVIDKFADRYFTRRFVSGERSFRTIGPRITNMDGYNIRSANGMRDLNSFLCEEEIITIEEKRELDFLIDAFNRMATRAVGFMGLTINSVPENDLRQWDGAYFKQFYVNVESERTVGIYPKIWSMVLQQGFGNPEAIPIDNWIEAFYSIPLQIGSKEEFLRSFNRMGKFERMLWITAQARKTNMFTIFDWVWCLKRGTGKTTIDITEVDVRRLRNANPLSCLKCPLKDVCLGYMGISKEDVFVMDVPREVPTESELRPRIRAQFVVLTFDSIPKYVFQRGNGSYELIDGFTGLEIHELETSYQNERTTVAEFITDLLS